MKLTIRIAFCLSAAFILVANAHAHIAGVKLDDAKCKEAWAKASPDGNAILPEKAAPYVADYNIVDMDGDGSISWEEFKTACIDGMMNTSVEATLKGEGGKSPDTPAPTVSAPAQTKPTTYEGARLDAFGKAGTVEILGVELPNPATKDTHVAILLSGINVTSAVCSKRIWHIPRNKIVSFSPLKDAVCPGGNVTKYVVPIDAVPIEEVFVARPLRDLIGADGRFSAREAKVKLGSCPLRSAP